MYYLTKEIKDIYDSDLTYHLAEMNIPFEKDLNLLNDHFSLKYNMLYETFIFRKLRDLCRQCECSVVQCISSGLGLWRPQTQEWLLEDHFTSL